MTLGQRDLDLFATTILAMSMWKQRSDKSFIFEGLPPSTYGNRLIPWRWRYRCRDARVRCGMVGSSA